MSVQDDFLQHGVAIGERETLWRLLNELPPDRQVPEAFESAWSQQRGGLSDAAGIDRDAIVRGMFEMLCNHLQSQQAAASFDPLRLLVLLRGDIGEFDGFVTTLDEAQLAHLMVLRPGVFVMLADRFLRALTCAEVQPELGDLGTCQSAWSEEPLSNQPRDAERFQLAMNLSMLSALVVFYHEFAHILRGHSAWAARCLGVGHLRENRTWSPLRAGAVELGLHADASRRALEVDADTYAGVFMAKALNLGLLGEVNEDNLPRWCELMAFLATVTFNVFEEHVRYAGYRAGYHLPNIRTECFLEGVAHTWGVRDLKLFVAGMNAGLAFCDKHYCAPCGERETKADMRRLEQETWPALIELRKVFSRYVPEVWLARGGD